MARMSGLSAVLAKIDADIEKLQAIREYLTDGNEPVTPADPPRKRGRKTKAKPDGDGGNF